MNTQKQGNNSTILKIIVALLGVGILGLGYYAYDMNTEFTTVKKDLQLQKEELINELEGAKLELNQAIQEKTEVSDQLVEAKSRIESLIDEIKKTKKLNAGVIAKYRKEIATLKAQRDELYQIADSLRMANMQLVEEKDSLSVDLEKQKKYADTLLNKNEQLSQTINKAKILYPTNVVATAVKIKKSGKIVETTRRRRTDQVRVCFNIPKNDILEYGSQKFYVKVVNPDGEIIGTNEVISTGDNKLKISASEEVVYDNKPLKVCIFVEPQDKEKEIIKGDYLVEVYHNGHKVGKTNLILK